VVAAWQPLTAVLFLARTTTNTSTRSYSPNLSKRTTHLVTPDVVGSVSQKLAAVGGSSGARFPGLHIVRQQWVAASTQAQGKADEQQFRPALPQVRVAGQGLLRRVLTVLQDACTT
jgi:hypothetical protein